MAEAVEIKAEDTDLIHVERLDKDEYIPNERDDDFEGEDDEDILEINGDALNPDVVGIEEDELPQAANQLPLGFIRNPGTLSFYFFLGIYTGDGFHNQANTIIGIGLKATFFAYMYQLLTFYGVPQPRLNFTQQTGTGSGAFNIVWP